MPAHTQPKDDQEALTALNRLFVRTLRALSDNGGNHEACELAAEGWSLLRSCSPAEAERLNGVLHYLTAPSKHHEQPQTVAVSVSKSHG